LHSEFNASKTDEVHFLQIWIQPDQRGIAPGYAQKTFTTDDKRGRLRLVASPDGADGSISINADTRVYAGVFETGDAAELALPEGRYAWLHVARGKVVVNGTAVSDGDGVALTGERAVRIEGLDAGEVLLFDLA
jgi:redox-sensitive bicupin YhaK (pirin superfamily)